MRVSTGKGKLGDASFTFRSSLQIISAVSEAGDSIADLDTPKDLCLEDVAFVQD